MVRGFRDVEIRRVAGYMAQRWSAGLVDEKVKGSSSVQEQLEDFPLLN